MAVQQEKLAAEETEKEDAEPSSTSKDAVDSDAESDGSIDDNINEEEGAGAARAKSKHTEARRVMPGKSTHSNRRPADMMQTLTTMRATTRVCACEML